MHVDHDDLALLAIGEGSAADRAHVARCGACRTEVASLSAVRELVLAGGPVTDTPPARVWAGIEQALAGSADPLSSGDPSAVTVTEQPGPDGPRDEVGERRRRRAAESGSRQGRRTGASGLGLVAAAAAGALVTWVGLSLGDTGPDTDDLVVASAQLDALDDTVQPASAQIVERDGERLLVVDASELPQVEDGYLEVWLLKPDASGMVTVGLLQAGQTEFVLPADLSTDTFPVVDVSVEHYDGDPTHSGNSLWRGAVVEG
jgi:hypothetical protein